MDELQRRALARLPLSEVWVREAYYTEGWQPYARRVVRSLCESHERLRGELFRVGEEVVSLTAENAALRARVQELESATREVCDA